MAATRLIAIHHLKGKTLKQCLNERIEYSLNSVKTENGEYVSFYECAPETVIEEFALSKREYELITGRHQQRGVIAYMIRQSFKPDLMSSMYLPFLSIRQCLMAIEATSIAIRLYTEVTVDRSLPRVNRTRSGR